MDIPNKNELLNNQQTQELMIFEGGKKAYIKHKHNKVYTRMRTNQRHLCIVIQL